ncbi:TetR/AcrR family transcriptional regulator [Pseudonocardia xinjiangensis]|uniref:TetR/AcrR family transcriptional regulator n=1 Tax=Pseudonocardia xinjiangensis TaxID=75289 RepID=UPI003D924D6B
MSGPGLRQRKRERTRETISDTAIGLFLVHGFDSVTVAQIAAAAEVSKPTLFRYFPTKEDLLIHRFADHQGEAARVVQARRSGEAPLDALHRHYRERLAQHDPITGLCDDAEVLAFHGLVFTTPTVAARLAEFSAADVDALAAALRDGVGTTAEDLRPRLVAAQVITAQHVLARENWAKLAGGRTADEVHPQAAADADMAFTALRQGVGSLGF